MRTECLFYVGLATILATSALAAGAGLKPLDAAQLARIETLQAERAETAEAWVSAKRHELGLNESSGFRARNAHTDEFGQTHVRFDQYYKGVRVLDGEIIVHLDADGRPLKPTSALCAGIDLSVTPTLTGEVAARVAEDELAKAGECFTDGNELVIYPVVQVAVKPSRSGVRSDDLRASDMMRMVGGYELAYLVETIVQGDSGAFHRFGTLVEAHTGAILRQQDLTVKLSNHTAPPSVSLGSLDPWPVTGTGKSLYSGKVSVSACFYGAPTWVSPFYLQDVTRGNTTTVDAMHREDRWVWDKNCQCFLWTPVFDPIYKDPDNTWGDYGWFCHGMNTQSDRGQTAAVDAHYAAQVTWDLFQNVFRRNGFSGNGSGVVIRVHYGQMLNDAMVDLNSGLVAIGDGDCIRTRPWASIDVVGHELGHLFEDSCVGLWWGGSEAHALAEANADIIATLAEFYARGAGGKGQTIPNAGGNWTLGEQIVLNGGALRYMIKPSLDGQSPDAWSPALANIADPHISAGPMNRAFYFMAQGASADPNSPAYSPYLPRGMAGIGNHNAARIWYRAMTVYLTKNATYLDARAACMMAAKDLYGRTSTAVAVPRAFTAVNVN
ncbi:MAG: M4 family metallopeptidase [Acidobacteriota bacterium]